MKFVALDISLSLRADVTSRRGRPGRWDLLLKFGCSLVSPPGIN